MFLRPLGALLGSVLTLSALTGGAEAQDIPEPRVQAGYKATIGLGLLGAELGFVIPTAFGLDETWSLITFPIVGAAGGAVGGYYLDRVGSAPASVSVLAVSLAFAVPTVILTVGATRYSTDDLEDDTRSAREAARRDTGTGLFRGHAGRLRLAMPGFAIGTMQAMRAGTLEQRPVFHLSIASGTF